MKCTLNHVNLLTSNIERMSRFYQEVLGFVDGYRPNFTSVGRWLYQGDTAMIHLVEVEEKCRNEAPQISHFAVSSSGLAEYLANLRRLNVTYRIGIAPEIEVYQVVSHDPDGNMFEVLFQGSEAEGVDTSDYIVEPSTISSLNQ